MLQSPQSMLSPFHHAAAMQALNAAAASQAAAAAGDGSPFGIMSTHGKKNIGLTFEFGGQKSKVF